MHTLRHLGAWLLGVVLFGGLVPGTTPEASAQTRIQPITCGTYLKTGFWGSQYYQFDLYFFNTLWRRVNEIETGLAEYVAHPDPNPVDIFGGKRWYNAGIRVKCYQVAVFNGTFWETGATIYDPLEAFDQGRIGECGEEEGGMVEEQPYTSEGYEPYDSREPGAGGSVSSGCSPSGQGGGGGGGNYGGGEAGPSITEGSSGGGGNTGGCADNMPFYYDYACVEQWVEGEGWKTVWCGVMKFC